MKRAHHGLVLLIINLMLGSTHLYAWNNLGHMVVASVAYQHLTDASKTRANALIKQNPFFERWLKMIPPGTNDNDRDMMLFMIASTFPDQIKSDDCYVEDGAPGSRGNRPEGRRSSLNVGYADHLMHKYWHFVDNAFSRDGTSLPVPPSPNAETQINIFLDTLNSDADDDLKSFDLVWLLHLVGDVHQPLHGSTRVSSGAPGGDNGGNDVKVCRVSLASCNEKLHAFWDGALGSGDVADAEEVAGTLPAPDSAKALITVISTWINESFQDAQSVVYIPPIGPGNGPFLLTSTYKDAAKQEAKERIALAGVRLANVLNEKLN